MDGTQVWTTCKPSGVSQAQNPSGVWWLSSGDLIISCSSFAGAWGAARPGGAGSSLPDLSREEDSKRLPFADPAWDTAASSCWSPPADEVTKCLLLRSSASLICFREKSTRLVCIGALSHLCDFAWSRLGNAHPCCSQTMLDTGVTIRNYMCQYFDGAPHPEHGIKALMWGIKNLFIALSGLFIQL